MKASMLELVAGFTAGLFAPKLAAMMQPANCTYSEGVVYLVGSIFAIWLPLQLIAEVWDFCWKHYFRRKFR